MKGDIFHLLNRGVEKRKVFLDERDYLRFVYDLYDFNTTENVIQSYYRRRKSLTDIRRPSSKELVDVLCWCLLPNHPHIMAEEKIDGGISVFSKKMFGGYTKYFNERNSRAGVLFQGKSKIIPMKREEHSLYLPFYIHANSLNLFQRGWKEQGVKDVKKALAFLEGYRWSNYRTIVGTGEDEFSSITNRKLFFEMFDTNEKRYRKNFEEWLSSFRGKEDSNKIPHNGRPTSVMGWRV